MNMSESNNSFEKQAKALFDESVDQLDAATLSKLNRRRHEALSELHSHRLRWMRWAPAAGVAAALVVAVMLALPQTQIDSGLPVTDMDILLSEDSIEMLEDLEFYAWLDMQEEDIG
jgi:hypothetical protein